MAEAGYCSQCNAQVWVNPDGSCANGHGPECVSGVYAAAEPVAPPVPAPPIAPGPPEPQPVTGAEPKKSNAKIIWIVVAVVVLLLCACCGIGSLVVLPQIFKSASNSAAQRSCFANERTMEGAYQQYLAAETAPAPVTDMASLTSALVDTGYLKSVPKCPTNGVYTIEPQDGAIKIICSVHGSYQDAPLTPTP